MRRNKIGWQERITHPHLKSKRGLFKSSLRKHSQTRHQECSQPLINNFNHELGQGTLFPNYIESGDITWIENYVTEQWTLYRKQEKIKKSQKKNLTKRELIILNSRTKVTKIQKNNIGLRIKVRLNKFGIKFVGAYLINNKVATVFPEENCKGTPLRDFGKKVNKSIKRL